MSDDDREEHNGVISYRIRHPVWRNRVLTRFLRVFDQVGALHKEEETVHDRRGNPVHTRIMGGPDIEKRPVRGLPANAYSEHWKQTLSEDKILRLAEGPDYEFVHDPVL